jgi:protein kinase C substrate 80K-H
MRTVRLVAAAILITGSTCAAALPRGVMKTLADKYQGLDSPGATFTCLGGDSTSVPAGYVNDNYCDCPDGSDEPGTAACTYLGDRYPTELRFQCANTGYADQLFFHSRVNDGICDCCDGSDEYLPASQGGIECPNTCAEAHEKAEKERAERERVRQAGLAAKADLVREAAEKQESLTSKLAEHKGTLATVDVEITNAEADKAKWEAEEKAERDDIHRKSLEEKAVWEQAQAEKKRLAEEEAAAAAAAEPQHPVAEEASGEAHSEAHGAVPPSVICTKWRQTGDCKGNGPRQPDQDRDCDAIIEAGSSGFCECIDVRTGLDVEYPFDCNHKRLTCEKMCEAEGRDTGFLAGDADLKKDTAAKAPEEETFKVDTGSSYFKEEAKEARTRSEEAQRKKRDAEREVKEIEEQLSGELYGPDQVFLALKGKCFDRKEGHYTYTICPFDRIKQAHTNMGSWKSWGEQSYGSWGGKYDFAKMIYDNGERCWSGPSRSTEVRVVCGPTNEILSVDEPSMCTYKMVFQTPAICE